MPGPLLLKWGTDRPRPIGARVATGQPNLARDFSIAQGMRGKASGKPLLTWALVDPAVASRKPRPKVGVAPPISCRGPPSHPGQVGGPR
jgi:hypothetical protein